MKGSTFRNPEKVKLNIKSAVSFFFCLNTDTNCNFVVLAIHLSYFMLRIIVYLLSFLIIKESCFHKILSNCFQHIEIISK